jgi:hypothetical protein
LEVLGKIKLSLEGKDARSVAGLPELMGFAYGLKQQRAELLITHCGCDLNKKWFKYMEQP